MSVSTTYSLDELDVLYLYSNSLSFSFFNVKTIHYWFIVVILNIKLWYNFNDNITNPNMLYQKWRFILLFIYILENLFLIYLYCIVISKTSYAKFTYIYILQSGTWGHWGHGSYFYTFYWMCIMFISMNRFTQQQQSRVIPGIVYIFIMFVVDINRSW